MNILENLYNEGQKVKLEEKAKDEVRSFLMSYCGQNTSVSGEIVESDKQKQGFIQSIASGAKDFFAARIIQTRALVAAQYAIIEGIWKRKNDRF